MGRLCSCFDTEDRHATHVHEYLSCSFSRRREAGLKSGSEQDIGIYTKDRDLGMVQFETFE
jgi:hypothetical protein